MGFHICEYCTQRGSAATSSGDVTLRFSDGQTWEMPDMIVHYIQNHGYLPPQEFIDDVLLGQHVAGERWQTKSITSPTSAQSIGYLSGDYPQGETPAGFLDRLQVLMEKAKDGGDRRQTRGI